MKRRKNYKVYKNHRSIKVAVKITLLAALFVAAVAVSLFFILKHFTVYENGVAHVMIPWLESDSDSYERTSRMAINAAIRVGKSAHEPSPNPFALPSRQPSPSPLQVPPPSPSGGESEPEASPSDEPLPLEGAESPPLQ